MFINFKILAVEKFIKLMSLDVLNGFKGAKTIYV